MKEKKPCGLHCLKIKDIGVTIGGNTIIEHVNLHVHCGALTVIIGKNGAGKSTLINAILGEIPHTGEIEFQLLDSPNGHENLKIGYVPQHMNIEKDTPASVYDLMASFLSKTPVFLRKNKKLYGELKEQLAIFEAEDLIDKQIGALSGGELQRVLLSMAIIPVPNLLLLDEPVSGIDQNGMELFYQKINHLKENYDLSIILISHDLEYVRKYADQVVLLDTTVIKQGTVKEVFSSEEFRRVFGTAGYTEEA